MEMFAEDVGVREQILLRVEERLAVTKYVEDWTNCREGLTGKHQSELVFGEEHPIKEDWRVWRRELSRIHSSSWALILPLVGRKQRTNQNWRYCLEEESDELLVAADKGIEVYST